MCFPLKHTTLLSIFDGIQAPCDIKRFMVLKKDICTQQTVSTHPDICCHSVQVSESVTRLCHDGPVKQGVLCRYGVHGTASSEKLKNLHLIAFSGQAIKGSSKCLQEINRLRQTYHPDLPQYTVPHEPKPQKRKQKQN